MKRIIITAMLAAFALPAMAEGYGHGNRGNGFQVKATSGAEAGALSLSGVNIQNPAIPVDTKTRVEAAPAMGGLMGWAYGAGSGNCIGPSESTAASGQVSVIGTGVGLGGGRGTTNLDWGCVLRREMEVADARCKGGFKQACDDLNRLYEMQPGISAIRAGTMPDYAKAQTVEKPAPAPRAAAPAAQPQPQRTAAVQQPTNCTADPFIANRTGMALCK